VYKTASKLQLNFHLQIRFTTLLRSVIQVPLTNSDPHQYTDIQKTDNYRLFHSSSDLQL